MKQSVMDPGTQVKCSSQWLQDPPILVEGRHRDTNEAVSDGPWDTSEMQQSVATRPTYTGGGQTQGHK